MEGSALPLNSVLSGNRALRGRRSREWGPSPARWAGFPITLLMSNVRAVLGTALGVTHRGARWATSVASLTSFFYSYESCLAIFLCHHPNITATVTFVIPSGLFI